MEKAERLITFVLNGSRQLLCVALPPASMQSWHSTKCERIYLNEYDSINALQKDIDDYIEFYNHRRFHETLAYKKPMKVYKESILNENKLSIAA